MTKEIEKIAVEPYFDLEDFMNMAHESKLSTQALNELLNLWEKWAELLQARKISSASGAWLALWLPEEVEKGIDAIWETSPSKGFMASNLANYMCMAAIQELLPQASQAGCAPAPEFTQDLKAALYSLQLLNQESRDAALTRRHAVITNYPFIGGCEVCALKEECPKIKGSAMELSVVLPGYEKGVKD